MRTVGICLLILAEIGISAPIVAAQIASPTSPPATIIGTVTDVKNDVVPGATVVLEDPVLKAHRTVVANDNGFFELQDLRPGTPYQVIISAGGFANWTSPPIILKPGQSIILTDSKLKIAEARTTINVSHTSEEIATEQIRIEEKQRVLGIIPNFYVVYNHNAEPLTTGLKFKLALKTASDPVTIIGVAMLAGMNQAGDTPDYGQGWKSYAQRFGAVAADGFSDIMIGGAILPSLLHQDPRYFYQGTGTKKSRALHALANPFVCMGDNGKSQPNYSSIGGDLASAALSNIYYPASNRGAGLVLSSFLINTGERMLGGVLKEFVLRKLTTNTKNRN